MSHASLLVLALLVGAASAGGEQGNASADAAAVAAADVDEGRIVGGVLAEDGKYPFIVLITKDRRVNCGASILNNKWILSASHCFVREMQDLWRMRVLSGTNKLSSGGRVHRIVKVINHDQFNFQQWANDISVVKVCPPFLMDSKEAVVKLPSRGQLFTGGSAVSVIGWGRNQMNGVTSDDLKKADMIIQNDEDCNIAPFTKEKLCAIDPKGKSGNCLGDSGGPLFMQDDLTQVGIVSYSIGELCAVGSLFYAEVSNYIDWIDNAIKN